MTRFWMICRRPTHAAARTEPKARFTSINDARAEALRLAREADADFLILETVETVRPGQDTQTPSLL